MRSTTWIPSPRAGAQLKLLVRLLVAMLLLAACEVSTPTGGVGSGGASTSPTVTPTATVDPTMRVGLNWAKPPITVQDAQLSPTFQLTVNLQGADSPLPYTETSGASHFLLYSTLGFACNPWLVFTASSPASAGPLSAAEAQAMKAYLSNVAKTTARGLPIPDPNQPPPPSLRWVQGVVGYQNTPGDCLAALQITVPAGADEAQVTKVGLKLTADPAPNRFQYALINVCTIAPQSFIFCNGAGGQIVCEGAPFAYTGITLGAGATGTEFTGDPRPDCLPLDIKAGQTITAYVAIDPPSADTSAIYQVVPDLMVRDVSTGNTSTISLPALASTLAYAGTESANGAAPQFVCYGLSTTNMWVLGPKSSSCI